MLKYFVIVILFIACTFKITIAQIFYNSCDNFSISAGTVFHVNGDFENSTGGITNNNGEASVNGNYINNGTFSSGGSLNISEDFTNNSIFNSLTGSVFLNGSNQLIKGLVNTDFYNLTLSGTGIKTIQQNIRINGLLNLDNLELAATSFSITVLNNSLTAITRTSGFISTDVNGRLYRTTSSQNTYLFPLGSSSGTSIYRPAGITPVSTTSLTYYAALINDNPSTSSMPVSANDGSFCNLNDTYYHIAGSNSGVILSGISLFYDPVQDGNFGTIASWYTSQWHQMSPVSFISGTPLNNLTYNNWNPQTQTRFVVANTAQTISMPDDTSFCSGTSVTVSAGSGYDGYLWSNNASTNSITITTGGMYYVTVTSGPCSIVDSILVDEIASPVAFAGNDTAICYGNSITLTATGGNSYLWSNGSTSPSVTINPLSSGTLYVTVIENNCQGTDSVSITVNPLPVVFTGNDTTIYEGQSITLVPTFSGNIISYLWTPADYLSNSFIPSPVAIPPSTTSYILVVTDVAGCTSTDGITITVVEDPNATLIFYNTFTPNNDGVNDTWYIENIDNFFDNFLQIFNRNGHLVYEKHGYNNEWDGKYYGNDLPAATYYFILKMPDGIVYKGDITIIR